MVKKTLSNAYILIIMALLYAPIILIIVFSFANTSNFTFRHGFTLEAYRSIFNFPQTPYLLDALKNTLFIAVVSSVVSTIMGSVAAIGIYNLKQRPRRIVENINQMPIINSEIVMAVALMLFSLLSNFRKVMSDLLLGIYPFALRMSYCRLCPDLFKWTPMCTRRLWIWAQVP